MLKPESAISERQKKAAQAHKERVRKFKEAVSQRKTFFTPSQMKKAIGDDKNKRKKQGGKGEGSKEGGRSTAGGLRTGTG